MFSSDFGSCQLPASVVSTPSPTTKHELAFSTISCFIIARKIKGTCEPILPNVLRNHLGYSRVAVAWITVLGSFNLSDGFLILR
jgi:hypothetical protein